MIMNRSWGWLVMTKAGSMIISRDSGGVVPEGVADNIRLGCGALLMNTVVNWAKVSSKMY